MLLIFGANIFDITCYQMAVLVPTSPKVCFYTTWENTSMRNRIKVQYFVGFVFTCSAKTNNVCSRKLNIYLIASLFKNIGVKNY